MAKEITKELDFISVKLTKKRVLFDFKTEDQATTFFVGMQAQRLVNEILRLNKESQEKLMKEVNKIAKDIHEINQVDKGKKG